MVRNEIKEIMQRVFELDQINEDISQDNCGTWDSLGHLNLIVELEEAFNISLEPEEINQMKNLDGVEKFVQLKTKQCQS